MPYPANHGLPIPDCERCITLRDLLTYFPAPADQDLINYRLRAGTVDLDRWVLLEWTRQNPPAPWQVTDRLQWATDEDYQRHSWSIPSIPPNTIPHYR